jgi:hypothetical protein
MVGLSNTWNLGTIYCSTETRIILQTLFPRVAAERVVAMEINSQKIIRMDDDSISFTMTLLEAYHCAGSVMVLLESTAFGNILHTGDFRFEKGTPMPPPLVKFCADSEAGVQPRLDRFIFDATFCIPFSFPTREESFLCLLERLQRERKHRVYLHLDTLGGEGLWAALCHHLGLRIFVENATKRRIFKSLPSLAPYVSDDPHSVLQLVDSPQFHEFVRRKREEEAQLLQHHPQLQRLSLEERERHVPLFVKPSALWFTQETAKGSRLPPPPAPLGLVKDAGGPTTIHRLCWSMHNDVAELMNFIVLLRPHDLCPFNAPVNRANLHV